MVWIVACTASVGTSGDHSGQTDGQTKQVKCGSVYVTEEDKTKRVTKKIVQQATASSEDKKKRSSKYTLAVGSSFGHIHTFLKDSDNVLTSIENTQAEDKCLMLIRKPKSASRQMLKAHSWANLNDPAAFQAPDTQRHQKNRGKRKPSDLSLLPDGSTATRWQQLPSNLPTTELASVSEHEEDTCSEVSPRQQEEFMPSLTNTFPFDHTSRHLLKAQEKSRSSSSLINFRNYEINNNRPGVGNGRPRGQPPQVPSRTSHLSAREKSTSNTQQDCDLDDKNNNKTAKKRSVSPVTVQSNNVELQQGTEIDPGCHGDLTLKNDELYEAGFKVASSSNVLKSKAEFAPIVVTRTKDRKQTEENRKSNSLRSSSSGERSHRSDSGSGSGSGSHRSSDQTTSIKGNSNNPKTKTSPAQLSMLQAQPVPLSKHHRRQDYRSSVPDLLADRHVARPHSEYYRNESNKTRPEFRSSVSVNEVDNKQRFCQNWHRSNGNSGNGTHSSRTHSDSEPPVFSKWFKEPRYSGSDYVAYQEHLARGGHTGPDSEDSVARSCSLGDLNAGLTFSLVGQRKSDNFRNLAAREFSGKEQAKRLKKVCERIEDSLPNEDMEIDQRIRSVRHPQSVSKHDSLPVRGRSSSQTTTTRHSEPADRVAKEFEKMSFKGGNSGSRPAHHSSLQHLPCNGELSQRQITAIRSREKTPLKPRRALPQVPGNADVRKKHFEDLVKLRMTLSSRGSGSSGSQTSSQTGRNESSCGRVSPSATPSDREVSQLLEGSSSVEAWDTNTETELCNIFPGKHEESKHLPESCYDHPEMSQSLRSSDSFGSQDHSLSLFAGVTSGGRLSESGQTTLTSQSTIDSGYITNDPEPDSTLSTSSYAKTLKQSAQNLYTANKLFKPPNGLHSNKSPPKDVNTQSWLEKHPDTHTGTDKTQTAVAKAYHHPSVAKGDNSGKVNGKSRTEPSVPCVASCSYQNPEKNHPQQRYSGEKDEVFLDVPSDLQNNRGHSFHKPQQFANRTSDLSVKDIEKVNAGDMTRWQQMKGKSASLSYGLNLIEPNLSKQSQDYPKSRPKFTGSLKDLMQAGKQLQLETSRRVGSLVHGSLDNLAGTQPGDGSTADGRNLDSSLKAVGKPSLFQLLQSYHLYPVRIRVPENFSILKNTRLVECEVVLPSPWTVRESPSLVTSPKGSYAKLGGPGSAFKPVVSGASGNIGAVTMVTVVDLTSELMDKFESGQINKGDLIVEVNERLVMGEDLVTLTTMLNTCHQGELLLTVARDKARDPLHKQVASPESPELDEARRMESKINQLTTELRKKDRTLKQLNALLPWKPAGANGHGSGESAAQDGYICSLSEDEFIV